ncbi:MAG: DUF1045 domain-containing protein [Acetobacteraceae bacterium]|nr:DUF1045 domain-containing protein [Acetobacteraceae bacterium]
MRSIGHRRATIRCGRPAAPGSGATRRAARRSIHEPEPIATREDHARLIADAARYGWHATLKAPFRLAEGESEERLDEALQDFAAQRSAFPAPRLVVSSLAGFLAVVPAEPCPPLSALAEKTVRAFDRFRAPPTEEELARRQAVGLTPRQQSLLATWGYPYVMDEWRFHMTLTARLPSEHEKPLRIALAERFAYALAAPLAFRELALYVEPAPGAPFRLLRRYPFKAG